MAANSHQMHIPIFMRGLDKLQQAPVTLSSATIGYRKAMDGCPKGRETKLLLFFEGVQSATTCWFAVLWQRPLPSRVPVSGSPNWMFLPSIGPWQHLEWRGAGVHPSHVIAQRCVDLGKNIGDCGRKRLWVGGGSVSLRGGGGYRGIWQSLELKALKPSFN